MRPYAKNSRSGMTRLKMRPFPLSPVDKKEVRTQIGGLCYRVRDGKPEFLLVTSRGTGRWVIPKGWPVGGKTTGAAALQEAWEEAGVVGKLVGNAIGVYAYLKREEKEDSLPCIVAVFPVKVKRLVDRFPEARERRRKWFSRKKAAAKVDEQELRQIILSFDPATGTAG